MVGSGHEFSNPGVAFQGDSLPELWVVGCIECLFGLLIVFDGGRI